MFGLHVSYYIELCRRKIKNKTGSFSHNYAMTKTKIFLLIKTVKKVHIGEERLRSLYFIAHGVYFLFIRNASLVSAGAPQKMLINLFCGIENAVYRVTSDLSRVSPDKPLQKEFFWRNFQLSLPAMTVDKINDMRSRVAGIRRFL